MTTKINHPFKVPDSFFDNFKNDMSLEFEKESVKNQPGIRKIATKTLKYAAILVFALFAGYSGYFVINHHDKSVNENITIDEIYSQVSDEEVTSYIIENVTSENFNQIKFE